MKPTTSRRALLGGVPAVLALGATAIVPALAVEPNADAEIIRLADAIMAGNAETMRLNDLGEELDFTPENEGRRAQLRAQIAPLVREGWAMRARLAGMQATTLAGWQAKARVVREINNCSDGYTTGYDDEALGWSLANDVLGLPSVLRVGDQEEEAPAPVLAAARPNPDAELIALCAKFVALDCELCALFDQSADLLPDNPLSDTLCEQQTALVPHLHELEDEIADWTAETPEGLRALVQAAQHTLSSDARRGAVDVPDDASVAWAALESVLGMLDARRLA